MKTKVKSRVTAITSDIDYENGFHCEYTLKNGKVSNFRFYNNLYSNLMVVDDGTLEKLKNTHWSMHYHLFTKQKMSKKLLETFKDFDKLYYIGGGHDGMTAHANGVFISTPVLMDDTFFQIYEKIETTTDECQKILDSLNDEFILTKDIVHIPYYNQNEGATDHCTISLMAKIPDDEYLKIMGGSKHLSDNEKMEIFKFLKLRYLWQKNFAI